MGRQIEIEVVFYHSMAYYCPPADSVCRYPSSIFSMLDLLTRNPDYIHVNVVSDSTEYDWQDLGSGRVEIDLPGMILDIDQEGNIMGLSGPAKIIQLHRVLEIEEALDPETGKPKGLDSITITVKATLELPDPT